MHQGAKLVAGNNRNLKAALKAADLDSLNLLAAYEHAPVPRLLRIPES